MDGRTTWKQYIPPQTKFTGGIIMCTCKYTLKRYHDGCLGWSLMALTVNICIKVMSSRSVYLTTLFLGKLSPLSTYPVFVHVLLLETDNCLFWISGRERMMVENISWSVLTKECCQTRPDQSGDLLSPVSCASNWASEADGLSGNFFFISPWKHIVGTH